MSLPIAQPLAERDAYKELAQALRQVVTTTVALEPMPDQLEGQAAAQHRLAVAEARLIELGLEVV